MSGRWQVAQHIYNRRWLVVPPGYDGSDSATRLEDYGDAARAFRTHAQALAFADRQARTVKVTLPMPDRTIISNGRVWYLPGTVSEIRANNGKVLMSCAGRVVLAPGEAREQALAPARSRTMGGRRRTCLRQSRIGGQT